MSQNECLDFKNEQIGDKNYSKCCIFYLIKTSPAVTPYYSYRAFLCRKKALRVIQYSNSCSGMSSNSGFFNFIKFQNFKKYQNDHAKCDSTSINFAMLNQ